MVYPAIRYQQSSFTMIASVLPLRIISRFSKTLIYGKDIGGYQRIPDEKHYKGILKYAESDNFIFPGSIILACDKSDIETILNDTTGSLDLDFNNLDQVIFRVVDGQHRLLGISKAAERNVSLLELGLPVSIVVTEGKKRSVEMEIFNNINSKAKRLKTDLIELARFDYRLIEEKIGGSELNSHVAMNTAFNLNENVLENNVWQNAIKIDIHAEFKLGIIGVKAFSESVSGIVESYLNLNSAEVDFSDDKALIQFSRKAGDDIGSFMSDAWSLVKLKWPKAFNDILQIIYDIDGEYKSVVYNPDYYVQKTLGCKSINYILSDLLKEKFENQFNTDVLNIFEEILRNCKLIDDDWLVGKTLSGISSESGFNRVSRIIRNLEPFSRRS